MKPSEKTKLQTEIKDEGTAAAAAAWNSFCLD